MSNDGQLSSDGQATLSALQQSVTKTLERKRRLGQYAVVWRDGGAVLEGGEADSSDRAFLLAEKSFLEGQLASLPAGAELTRMSIASRLRSVDTLLAESV